MKFNVYDWDLSSYRNAKNKYNSEHIHGTMHFSKFRSHIDGAFEQSKNDSVVDYNKLGLDATDMYICSGTDYINAVKADNIGIAYPIPPSNPSIKIDNPNYIDGRFGRLSWITEPNGYCVNFKPTQKTPLSPNDDRTIYTGFIKEIAASTEEDASDPADSTYIITYDDDTAIPTVTLNELYSDFVVTIVSGCSDVYYEGSIPTAFRVFKVTVSCPIAVPPSLATELVATGTSFLDSSAKFNTIPSITLKKFIAENALDNDISLGIKPMTYHNEGGPSTYTSDDLLSKLIDVQTRLTAMDTCYLVWAYTPTHIMQIGKVRFFSRVLTTATLFTSDTEHTNFRWQTSRNPTKAERKHAPASYKTRNWSYYSIDTTVDSVDVIYNDDITFTYGVSDVSAPTTTKIVKPLTLATSGIEEVLDAVLVNKVYGAYKDSIHLTADYISLGYDEAAPDTIEDQHFLGEVMKVLPKFIIDADSTSFTPENLQLPYSIHITKDVVLQAVSNMIEVSTKFNTLFGSHIQDIAKSSEIGRLLKDANYLEELLRMEDIAKKDGVYIAFRLANIDGINAFNDTDIADNRFKIKDLIKRLPKFWEYVHVLIKEDKVIGYIPNWTKMKKGSIRHSSAILTAMISIDAAFHVNKPSWWVKNRNAVVQLVVTVVAAVVCFFGSGGNGGAAAACAESAWLATATVAAVIASLAALAASVTDSKKWAKLSQIAGYVGMAAGIGEALKGSIKMYLLTQMPSYAIQALSYYRHTEFKQAMDKITDQIDTLSEDVDDMNEFVTTQKAQDDVRRFMFGGVIDDRYSGSYALEPQYFPS